MSGVFSVWGQHRRIFQVHSRSVRSVGTSPRLMNSVGVCNPAALKHRLAAPMRANGHGDERSVPINSEPRMSPSGPTTIAPGTRHASGPLRPPHCRCAYGCKPLSDTGSESAEMQIHDALERSPTTGLAFRPRRPPGAPTDMPQMDTRCYRDPRTQTGSDEHPTPLEAGRNLST